MISSEAVLQQVRIPPSTKSLSEERITYLEGLLSQARNAAAVFTQYTQEDVDRIVGLERAESDALLDELGAEARQPQHHFGHVWHAGDVVVWDNRATMHRVMLDYPVGENRVMQRVLIEGDRPV